MFTKQVSVFLENKSGRLADVTGLLAEAGLNIRALCLADTADFGVLRIIVDDRPRCVRILKAHDLAVQETDVLAVEIPDRPGALHEIVGVLDDEEVSVEYMYTLLSRTGGKAIVVFKSDDAARAVEALKGAGLALVPDDMIENL